MNAMATCVTFQLCGKQKVLIQLSDISWNIFISGLLMLNKDWIVKFFLLLLLFQPTNKLTWSTRILKLTRIQMLYRYYEITKKKKTLKEIQKKSCRWN